jgi:hypothetical protein
MSDHRNWALSTAAVFIISAILYFIQPNLRRSLVGILLVISASLVAVTGFKGGEVVYRYGLGIMSLPQVSEASKNGDGHDHGGSTPTEMEGAHEGHSKEAMIEKNMTPKPHLDDGHSH